MAVVAGAGTGKSRLLHEFKAALTLQCRVLEAYSVSHGKNSPYLPILDLLNGYFGLTDKDDQERRRERIETQLGAIDPGLKDVVPYLAEITSEARGRKLRPASASEHLEPQIAGTTKALEYGPLAVRLAVSTLPIDPGRDHHRQARDSDPLAPARIPCVLSGNRAAAAAVQGSTARFVT